jgi:hypothetical protein
MNNEVQKAVRLQSYFLEILLLIRGYNFVRLGYTTVLLVLQVMAKVVLVMVYSLEREWSKGCDLNGFFILPPLFPDDSL